MGNSDLITLFLPDLSGGGAERVMLNLAGAFIARAYRVDLVVLRAQGELLDEIPQGTNLVVLQVAKPRLAIRPLRAYLRKKRPWVLLSTLSQLNWAACLAARLSRTGTRCIVTEANQLSVELASLDAPSRWLRPRLLRWSCRCAQHLSVSKGAARDLARSLGVPDESVHMIYNPVISESLLTAVTEVVDHPWFQEGQAPVVLASGRLHRQKGFDILLNAFAQLNRGTPARLVILGEGPERLALEAQRDQLGLNSEVSLPGFVRNPFAFMARAAVFVLSSRHEGLGNVLVEALACGTRVIAADCPSGPGEILDGGRFGRLVPPEDPDALALGLREALDGSHPVEDPTAWLQQFRVDAVADRYLKLMDLHHERSAGNSTAE